MTRFNFNGRWSRDFGIYVSGEGTFNSPERDITSYEIQGRNGNLLIDNGRFKNVQLTYPAFITRNFQHYAEQARQWLTSPIGYCILFDDYHPYEFRKARFAGPLNFSPLFMNRSATFDLTFDCKPQRFLFKDNDGLSFDGNDTLLNTTEFDALPLIRVYGNGNGMVTIGDTTFTLTGIIEYIDIDSELQDAFKGLLNENAKMNGEFPKLSPGQNAVSFSGGITNIRIWPRWWIL